MAAHPVSSPPLSHHDSGPFCPEVWDRERLDQERRAFLDLIRMANTLSAPAEIAGQLVVLVRHLSGCEAVAVRLQQGPGFPYAASMGFPDRFLASEDTLCRRDGAGRLLRDALHRPLLACLCGRVLLGQIDRHQPWFTARGSFVSNDFGEVLEQGTLGDLRTGCYAAGYQTVALFPIRRDGVTYGLIQCNDPRPCRLSADTVDLMENLAGTAAHLLQLAMA